MRMTNEQKTALLPYYAAGGLTRDEECAWALWHFSLLRAPSSSTLRALLKRVDNLQGRPRLPRQKTTRAVSSEQLEKDLV